MSNLNKVQIIGRLGQDPEIRYTQAGKCVASMSVAVSEKWKDQQGQQQERTEWFNVSLFGRLGEIAGEYLKKGALVYIEGKQRTEKWTDNNNQDRYSVKLIADQMQMLGGREGAAPGNQSGGYQQRPDPEQQKNGRPQSRLNQQGGNKPPMAEPDFDFDDDLPF